MEEWQRVKWLKKLNYEGHYDPSRLMTKNRKFNYSVGGRNIGKTTGFKIFLLKQYLKNGSKFVWERRNKNDIDKMTRSGVGVTNKETRLNNDANKSWVPKFLRDVFGDYLTSNSDSVMLCGEIIGRIIPVSLASSYQSNETITDPDIKYLVYDEFLRPGVYNLEMANNVLGLYDSVTRDNKDAKQIFITNAHSKYNEYFDVMNIVPEENMKDDKDVFKYKEFSMTDATCIEMVRMLDSGHDELKNTDYYKMAYLNRFDDDNNKLVGSKTKSSRNTFNVTMIGHTYGVWQDYDGYIYLSSKYDPSMVNVLLDDHKEDLISRESASGRLYYSVLGEAYAYGILRFENAGIREKYLNTQRGKRKQ